MIKSIMRIFVILLIVASSTIINAKSTIAVDQYYPDFKVDQDMNTSETIKNSSNKGIQFGGQFSPSIVYYKQSTNRSIATSVNSLHLWLKWYLSNNAYMYIRGKEVVSFKMGGDGFDYVDDIENLVDLDLAFFRFFNDDNSLNLSFGRKYFILGTGLVFNGRADGLEFSLNTSVIDIMVFSAYTGLLQKENNPYNLHSNDANDGSKRVFGGGTAEYDYENQTIYLLGMAQFDLSDEESNNRSRYNSQYYGLGAHGVAFQTLRYYSEVVYEMGQSYTSTTQSDNSIQDISAFAINIGMENYFNASMNPVALFQYAYGSGDNNRYSYSGSSGATGNTGGKDTGFIAFGSFLGGYAIRPNLSNLHIIRLGVALTPFSDKKNSLKQFAIITKYSAYIKDKKESVVNDGTIDLDPKREAFVGHGIDVALRWKLYHDLSLYLNYATIIPGETYETALDSRHLVFGGAILSF